MTRQKVSLDKRKRVEHACTLCQRRKQKCNGKRPCNTCLKRRITKCVYRPKRGARNGNGDRNGSPSERRQPDGIPDSRTPFGLRSESVTSEDDGEQTMDLFHDCDATSQYSSVSDQDDVLEFVGEPRMLQDPTGRLQYLGDSATLSSLQWVRMMVSSVAKECRFTEDPNRHRLVEVTFPTPPSNLAFQVLPEWSTTDILVESFFLHTHGFVDVLDRSLFRQTLERLYRSPLETKSTDLCLVYLVLAIGLVLATPDPISLEYTVINRLRAEPFDRAEMFYRSAKMLGDSMSGFEDADLWSVQALCLMSVYMLSISNRTRAYALHGMAVRSAYSLGLHSDTESLKIIKNVELSARRNLWRSLFVLDRFLAMSLGRPVAISERDCAKNSLTALTEVSNADERLTNRRADNNGLDAAVQCSQIIGKILKKVYSKRKVTTSLAQEIMEDCELWSQNIHPTLDPEALLRGGIAPIQGTAILHVQLLGCHSTILLTRPFFLHFCLVKSQNEGDTGKEIALELQSRREMFAKACLAASTQAIILTQAAFGLNYLPQRNPFVLYFLFAAAVIVLTNQFFGLYENPDYDTCIENSITILAYCGKSNPLADHLHSIVTSFRDIVREQGEASQSKRRSKAPIRPKGSRSAAPGTLSLSTSSTLINCVDIQQDSPVLTPNFASTPTSQASQAPLLHMRPPPDFISGPSSSASPVVRPESGHTPLSQIQIESLGRKGNEPAGSDAVGSDHEFAFDSLWDVQHNANMRIDLQMAGSSHASPIHAVGRGRGEIAFGDYHPYVMPPGPPGPPGAPAGPNQAHGVVYDPRIPLFQPGA